MTDGVGPLLQQLRDERGLSQCELGRRTGLNHAAISRLESGQRCPTAATVAALVRELAAVRALLPEEEATLYWLAGRIPPGVDVGIMTALLRASRPDSRGRREG